MITVVMTGGTSGLGRVAAQQIFETPGTRLLLGARTTSKASIETWPLDLVRLASVRAFAQAIEETLGATQIDVLVLNAGTQFANNDGRTEDGFETTFAVNHLAHYLLLRLLLPKLAHDATVVITTSDTHDPRVNPLGAPRQLDPELLTHPRSKGRTGFGAGFRAYSASKLGNLLTARALAASRDAAARQLRVIAYNPGFTSDTRLYRNWSAWARVMLMVARIVRPAVRLATVEQAGGALADLALGRVVPPPGRVYASLVRRRLTWPDPSELAQRDDVMHALWRESARMVGLPEEDSKYVRQEVLVSN